MRMTMVKVHLLLAAFFSPVLLLMAASGGLYLLGIKGELVQTEVSVDDAFGLNLESPDLANDLRAQLARLGISHSFEYLKVKGDTIFTRPTSRVHYEIKTMTDGYRLQRNSPDLQKSLIELHKGHGPTAFKTFQKCMALGFIVVILSGAYLGLTSPLLRTKSLTMMGLGGLVVLGLILIA